MRALMVPLGLVLSAILAGCVAEEPEITPDTITGAIDEILAAVVLDVDHDHAKPELHASSYNMAQVAYSALADKTDAKVDWTFGELDVVGDYAYVATLAPKGGFVVVDIKNPDEPKVVGRYIAATTYAADIKVTPDGKYAILGSQLTSNRDEWMPPAHLPPADPSSVGINGFQLVSVADKTNPTFLSFLPVEHFGVHMLEIHVIGGVTYAFGAPGTGGHVAIARLVDGAGAGDGLTAPPGARPVLVPAGKYTFPNYGAKNPPYGPIGPHDITVYDDPITGRPLMLVAAGLEGVQLVDVGDPLRPKLLGTWTGHEGLYVHTVMPAIVEGKRLIVAAPETFTAKEQQPLWIIDASDPMAMKTLATWRLPGETRGYKGDYLFSTHNMNIKDGHVYLSHFHAGVWILDISTLAKAAQPVIVGAFIPGESQNLGQGLGLKAAPLVWDAVPLPNGRVLVTDIPTGFYVTTDPVGPVPLPAEMSETVA